MTAPELAGPVVIENCAIATMDGGTTTAAPSFATATSW